MLNVNMASERKTMSNKQEQQQQMRQRLGVGTYTNYTTYDTADLLSNNSNINNTTSPYSDEQLDSIVPQLKLDFEKKYLNEYSKMMENMKETFQVLSVAQEIQDLMLLEEILKDEQKKYTKYMQMRKQKEKQEIQHKIQQKMASQSITVSQAMNVHLLESDSESESQDSDVVMPMRQAPVVPTVDTLSRKLLTAINQANGDPMPTTTNSVISNTGTDNAIATAVQSELEYDEKRGGENGDERNYTTVKDFVN